MPLHSKRITDGVARALAAPEAGYVIYWCPATPGFGVRVTASSARAWIAERRLDGKTVRRTLGKVAGAAAISGDAARKLQVEVSSELQRGTDRLESKRARIQTAKQDSLTLEAALKAYVKGKRRAKDKLPLKATTAAEYLKMVAPAGTTKTGKPTKPGLLFALAAKPLHRITADDIRTVHASAGERGERRQTYAMQVLRAVLRHNGVTIEGNPLAPTTAGAERVHLAPSRGNPSPIPPERLGAWWRAASAVANESADQLKFMLLTGARPGEAHGLWVGDVDLKGMRATLRDTKNRTDHTLILATQAAAIVSWHAQGKKAKDRVFEVADTRKTLAVINEAAGTSRVTPNKLRHTFGSIADELFSGSMRRALMNHASGDVGQIHYIGISESKLRAAWQAVADYIEAAK